VYAYSLRHSALAAALVLGGGSLACEAATVKIDNVTAVPYTELTVLHSSGTQPTGAVEKHVAAAGSSLWMVTFHLTPEWDEATEEMNFDSESFGLYDGATKVEHLGGMQTFGVLDRYWGPPYLYRPENWKTEKPPGAWKRVWISVLKGKPELLLRLTQLTYDKTKPDAEPKKTPYTAPVKLTGEPKPFDMNDAVEIRVRAVKLLEFIEDKNEYDTAARAKRIVNEGGSIMQLTLQLTPKQPNSLEAKEFNWSPATIGLSFGKGGRAVCIGMRAYGSITADTSETIEQTDGDIWDSKTVSVYFPVPSNLKSFDVTFFGQKVTSGTVP
jgi:hypothetical protein